MDCFKKKWESKSGNLGKEPEKSTEVMLCGFRKDQDIYEVESMYKLVDSFDFFLNLDLSHCGIWKMIRHDSFSHAGLDEKEFSDDRYKVTRYIQDYHRYYEPRIE